jgi:hypothetical protein
VLTRDVAVRQRSGGGGVRSPDPWGLRTQPIIVGPRGLETDRPFCCCVKADSVAGRCCPCPDRCMPGVNVYERAAETSPPTRSPRSLPIELISRSNHCHHSRPAGCSPVDRRACASNQESHSAPCARESLSPRSHERTRRHVPMRRCAP